MKGLLDDKEVRDSNASKLFEGPGAAFMFKRIGVRDYAAEQFAYVLGMPDHPDLTWREADWTDLRRRVHARLAELEKPGTKKRK
jgi:hypothetical protein